VLSHARRWVSRLPVASLFRAPLLTRTAGAYTRSRSAQLELSLCSALPNLTHECVPNLLKLSSDMNECKPLAHGRHRLRVVQPQLRVVRPHAVAAGRGLHWFPFQLNLSTFFHL